MSATEVTSCTTISSPGYYHLANDIVNSTATTCIWIKTSDVILDGRGYKIDGVSSSSSNRYGILVYKSGESLTNITLANITVTNWGMGVYLQNVSHITLINVHLIDNYGDGIILKSSNNITIKNCSIADNDVGITIGYYTRNLTLVDSEVVGNYIGINYENTVEYYPNNTIYNNIFNNTKNVYSQVNFYSVWNTTKQAGTNIIGGSYLGGNAWFTPSRDGFSDTCIDDDGDGICDTPYNINAHSTDYLPLTYGNAPPDLSEYSISGTVYYYGTQSGEIYIEVFYEMPWEGAAPLYFENISAPGSYSINVTEGIYYVSAFMDVNGNGTYDEGEPFGVAINRTDWSMADAINVRGTSVTGVDITLYESQDTTPPVITFVAPTPTSNSVLSQSYIFVNVTSNEPLATALLEWNGVNITMNGRGTNWYLNMTGLSNGVYQFRVYGRDLAGNWNSTEVRSVTISTPLVEDNYVLRILVTANPSDMEEDNGFVIDLTVISGMCIIIEEENYRLHLTSNKQLRGLSVQPSDTTPPVITFVAPTPTSNSVLSQSYIFVNVTSNEPLATALLEWNGVNITMNGRGTNWYLNMTGLSNGVYQFRVYGRDLAGNWNSTEVRNVTISTPLVEGGYILTLSLSSDFSRPSEEDGYAISLVIISRAGHVFEEGGYRIHLALQGLKSTIAKAQVSNTQPVAIFTIIPSPATINEEVEFNASLSYDPDGFIVDYTWNFGDGNITTTNQPIITHVYSSSGNYTVTLTVIDNDGSTNSLSKLLVVAVKGDFNDNNEVDIGDVSYVAYIVLGKMPQDLRADFNGNRRVDIGDLAKIAYYLIGKVDEL
ncbi:NosD domain-containing protein [Archaeoglobus sulfaticallidus]|uniref:NosD domain-containing protein n=1 Tax=Archaeoglobus sulfaticallidus TaxID=1316941 RepID=UPI0014616951|nr:NosD domain-containing protein [Archaeoglobus sulfaticallidus]